MPLYEYQCQPNGHRFEARHGIHDQVETCSVCGGPVRRVIHPVGIVFKGSGFYATDSRSPPPPKKEETPAGGAEKKAEAGKTPEPAKKSETPAAS
ncbi:MAG: FmdB family zinc ribbon protein [Chloroflexota bacterium]